MEYPSQTSQPNERHSIRHNEVSGIQHVLKAVIVLRFHHSVHSGNRDEMACVATLDPCFHLLDDFGDLHCVYPDTEHTESVSVHFLRQMLNWAVFRHIVDL